MNAQTLNGEWQFRQLTESGWLPGEVPGGVHTDLMRLGMIPDPFFREQEISVQWVAEADWEYRRRFNLASDLFPMEHIFLVCDGLDTLSEVWLNSVQIGTSDNMFRQYRWEVTRELRRLDNELRIVFSSPVRYISESRDRRVLPGGQHSIPGGSYLRKSPSQFGWDWGPKLPPIGVWRDIRLEGYQAARLEDVRFHQGHADGQVSLRVELNLERWSGESLEAALLLTAPSGYRQESRIPLPGSSGSIEIDIEHPRLWWPNGYGEQPLYQTEVLLLKGEETLGRRQYQIGLRTVSLSQEEDEWGRSFTFVVNGVPIFAKGSNWIPSDSFPTRITRDRLEHLIRSAALTHQNMLRVWGGGYYEDEHFYDLCDRYGLLVWQEMMFACGVYPLADKSFLDTVKNEVRDNVRRLRHRACLALWCGNNEMDWGWESWGWSTSDMEDLKAAYERFFYHALPAWIAAEDPEHAYWPSSPSCEIPFENANSQERGDTHYWEVWHGGKPFTAYREQLPRFMSEFGFQSLPPFNTIQEFTQPDDWNITSPVMDHHQRSPSGNELMARQMVENFREPKDFPSSVYLSMLLQAESIRYGVEHWRRNRHRVSGTLYWQLNDCWPAVSWSSIDYFGRWKALHYAARRFYAPLLVSLMEDDEKIHVHLTNDRLEAWQGSLEWTLMSLNGEALESGSLEAVIDGGASSEICLISPGVSEEMRNQAVVCCSLFHGRTCLSTTITPLVPNKDLPLKDPEITVEVSLMEGELAIDLSARSLARFVELSIGSADLIFSDNYFDLPPGRMVRVTCPLPEGWSLEEAREFLQARSLYDSYS